MQNFLGKKIFFGSLQVEKVKILVEICQNPIVNWKKAISLDLSPLSPSDHQKNALNRFFTPENGGVKTKIFEKKLTKKFLEQK